MLHRHWFMRGAGALALVVGIAALLGGGIALAGNHQPSPTVRLVGTEQFRPNALFSSSFHFAPGNVRVNSGDSVRWVHQERVGAPHSISIVEAGEVPSDVLEVVTCDACERILHEHFDPPGDPPRQHELLTDGGLNGPGDSFIIATGENEFGLGAPADKTVPVTAEPGTTLHYICAFHPWMQGTIEVVD